MPEFILHQPKSILNKKKYIDSWFWDRYTINPYNGCMFGCRYCDARSAKYHMPADFENKIVVKQTVAEMLHQRLSRARTLRPDVVGLGGVTDSYQGAEKKFKNTRQLLHVLAKHQYAVHIATKSTLVLRDTALLDEIGEKSWCTISVTITTVDPQIAKFLDYRAPSPQRRLETIKQLKAQTNHVLTGVLLIPVVPFLADGDLALESLYQAAKEAGADYVLFGGGMTMRDVQAAWFLRHLKQDYPELLPKYAQLYDFTLDAGTYDGQNAPPSRYMLPLFDKLLALSRQYELPWHIPRYLPHDFRYLNYRIAAYLLNQARLRQMRGRPWQKVFWAGQNIQNLSESIAAVAERDELGMIRNIDNKLQAEIEVLIEQSRSL